MNHYVDKRGGNLTFGIEGPRAICPKCRGNGFLGARPRFIPGATSYGATPTLATQGEQMRWKCRICRYAVYTDL